MYNCVFWRMIQKSKSDLVEFKVELWWEYSHPSYNSGTGCYLLLRGYSVAQCHDVILLSGYHFSNAPWGPTGPNLFFLLLQWNSKHVGWCWGSEVSTRGWWCSLCSPAPYTQQPLLSIGLCFNKKKKKCTRFFFFFSSSKNTPTPIGIRAQAVFSLVPGERGAKFTSGHTSISVASLLRQGSGRPSPSSSISLRQQELTSICSLWRFYANTSAEVSRR